MFICAQLDENDVVVTIARLAEPIERPNIVPLTEWRDLLGWRYDRVTGEFVEPEDRPSN